MLLFTLFIVTSSCLFYYIFNPLVFRNSHEYTNIPALVNDDNLIKNGIHVKTGFIDGEGLMTVVNNCTNCHSSKIVLQNRMNVEAWNSTIEWMQKTQNLWDLGDDQKIIVDYLVSNYPPKSKGRRILLTKVKWYELPE